MRCEWDVVQQSLRCVASKLQIRTSKVGTQGTVLRTLFNSKNCFPGAVLPFGAVKSGSAVGINGGNGIGTTLYNPGNERNSPKNKPNCESVLQQQSLRAPRKLSLRSDRPLDDVANARSLSHCYSTCLLDRVSLVPQYEHVQYISNETKMRRISGQRKVISPYAFSADGK
ncbi:hypothetical protein BDZ45DRAFT_206823 [Acephala macrosclerotiorum]|nr:hypothetical protein BDZ45DRAFT_206823 [Acephala macrosclerotiorum]